MVPRYCSINAPRFIWRFSLSSFSFFAFSSFNRWFSCWIFSRRRFAFSRSISLFLIFSSRFMFFSFSIRQPVSKSDTRSEEHTSELQSRFDLVCRLLLEKKNKHTYDQQATPEHVGHCAVSAIADSLYM